MCRATALPLVREQVPVGWKETNRLVEPEALRAVHTGYQDNLANALSRDPGVVHQYYQTNVSDELGIKVYLLYLAAMKGGSNMVSQLLNAGANVNATQHTDGQQNGWTALMVAAREGHTEVVTLLLETGAKVNAVNLIKRGKFEKVKRTALKKAIETGQAKIVEQLLKGGTKPGYSHMMKAVKTGQADIVNQLLDARAWLSLSKPLLEAVNNGNTEIVRLILESAKNAAKAKKMVNSAIGRVSFSDLDCTDGWTALMVAARRGHSGVVKLLLEAGAKVNVRRKSDGTSALDLAAIHDHSDLLHLILNHKSTVYPRRNKDGLYTHKTPMHWAAEKGHPECIRTLVNRGADIKATCTNGIMVLSVAHWSCKGILRRYGA